MMLRGLPGGGKLCNHLLMPEPPTLFCMLPPWLLHHTFTPLSDPLGVILIVDFFALRSNQHNWLIRVYNEWESTKNLSQLPNMAYSIAVAKFQRANQVSETSQKWIFSSGQNCLLLISCHRVFNFEILEKVSSIEGFY